MDKVKEELIQRGLDEKQVGLIEQYLSISGNIEEKLSQAEILLGMDEQGKKGLAELKYILDFMKTDDAGYPLTIDFTLARGLNYYTGTIFEVKATGVQMGSIGGGGRYDDLTGLFGVPGVPGVGISFGVDRIYDVMEESKLFPETIAQGTKVLFFNLGEAESRYAFDIMQTLRHAGLSCEIYHEQAKFDKQFKYAEKKRIPYIVIAGSEELANGTCKVKNLETGEQRTIVKTEILSSFDN